MRTTEIQLYKFEELSDEVQNKLIEKNRDILVQYGDWYHPVLDGFCEDMSEAGHDIDVRDISFSGFWSQGDGASFTTKNGSLSLRSLLKELGVKMKDLPRGFSKEIKQGLMTIDIVRWDHRYSHQNTVSVYLTYDGEDEKIEQAFSDLEDKFESHLRSYMIDLYNKLEKYYNELTTDEAVKEELIEIEDEYRETGEVFVK